MSVETIPMPKAGEMMETGAVVEWLVEEGEKISMNQPIAVIATDKAEFDLESPYAGTVVRLIAEIDVDFPVGDPVCEIDTNS